MPRLLLSNARVLTPDSAWDRGWLLIENERIVQIGRGDTPRSDGAQVIDAGGATALFK